MGTVTCCDRAEPEQSLSRARQSYAMAATAPLLAAQSDSVAYVLFTAGSTGQLAGKTYIHKESAEFILPLARRLDCPRGQRFLFMTPYAAQTSVLEMFSCFAQGGTLVIAPNDLDSSANRDRLASIDAILTQRVSGGAVDNSPATLPIAGRDRFTSAREDHSFSERESSLIGLSAPVITDLLNKELVDVCFLP